MKLELKSKLLQSIFPERPCYIRFWDESYEEGVQMTHRQWLCARKNSESLGEERVIPTWGLCKLRFWETAPSSLISVQDSQLPGTWQLSLPQGHTAIPNLVGGSSAPEPLCAGCHIPRGGHKEKDMATHSLYSN